MDEYENRLQATFAAHTTAELRQLVADLPLAQLRRNDPQRQAARQRAASIGVRIHLGAYLAMVVIVLTVWLVVGLTAGAWYFWPIWPILGAGIGVVGHALPIRFAVLSPWTGSRLDQSGADRVAGQFQAVTQAEFLSRLARCRSTVLTLMTRRSRDLLGGVAFGDEFEDLFLAA